MEGDDQLDRLLDLRGARHERAGLGVVDAEQLALCGRALGARLVLGGDGVERLVAEGERHDELADVVQEAGQVRDVRVGAGPVGDRLRRARHRGGVQVQVADRAATVPGARWKKR